MPGYVNYWFKEGKLAAHIKEEFKKYNVLTVHGTIVMNVLVFYVQMSPFSQLVARIHMQPNP